MLQKENKTHGGNSVYDLRHTVCHKHTFYGFLILKKCKYISHQKQNNWLITRNLITVCVWHSYTPQAICIIKIKEKNTKIINLQQVYRKVAPNQKIQYDSYHNIPAFNIKGIQAKCQMVQYNKKCYQRLDQFSVSYSFQS